MFVSVVDDEETGRQERRRKEHVASVCAFAKEISAFLLCAHV
jgi:hypothetical protein